MPNIANILKLEISRIARKEVRGETQSLKKAVTTYRSEIASLKRRSKDLEDQLRQLARAGTRAKVAPVDATMAQAVHGTRFSPKALASQRRRLNLSADRLGLLIGVSGQSIYNWEQATTVPHAKYLPAIAALKSLSVRQAAELVETRRK
jgi:DNA-binding transcriptional regulator YiaG